MNNIKEQLDSDTGLQKKLKNLGNQFSTYAIYSSLLILIILCVVTIFIETTAGG